MQVQQQPNENVFKFVEIPVQHRTRNLVGSPTDVHGHLLQKNAKISKKYNRKSRQGKGRGLAKKGGGGGGYTWGVPGSELLEEYNEDLDEDDLADLQYNQAKEKHLAKPTTPSLETKFTKLELLENLDKDVKPLIAEYFVNGDANDVAQSLRKFDVKQRGGELIAYILTMAVEKSNVHKELISRLLHDFNGVIFRSNDYINGFNSLFESLNDLSLDNPECSTDIGKNGRRRKKTTHPENFFLLLLLLLLLLFREIYCSINC